MKSHLQLLVGIASGEYLPLGEFFVSATDKGGDDWVSSKKFLYPTFAGIKVAKFIYLKFFC